MSISSSPVQQKAANNWTAGNTISVTGIVAPTDGNQLVLYFGSTNPGNTVASISQTGAVWQLAQRSNTNRNTEIWYAENVSGAGTTITVNLNYTPTAASQQNAELSEWSGLGTGTLEVASSAANAATSATPTSASVTPTSGRNALLIMSTRTGSGFSSGPTGGFTGLTNADIRTFGAYLVVPATAGSYQGQWTMAGSATWDVAIATFLAPAASGGLFGRSSMDGLSISGPKQFTRMML